MSIRLRLTLWYTALLALMLTLFAVLVYVTVSNQLTAQLDYEIQLRALGASRAFRAVAPDFGERRVPGRGDAARHSNENEAHAAEGGPPPASLPLLPRDATLYVQVLDASGGLVNMSPNMAQPLPVPRQSLRQALAGREVHDTVPYGSGRVELYTAPLVRDEQVVGVLQVAAPLESVDARLAQIRILLALAVLVAVGVAGAIGWFLAARALRPVDRMTRVARAIGESGDLSRRIDTPPQRDELGRLAATFNEMLERLQKAFEDQRRFLADASHELRTPVTSIRANAEALLRGGAADPAERDETLRAIRRESERMGRLVADLLALARADAGQPLEHRPLALDTLLLEVYQLARPLANGVQLELGELEQVEVLGDRDRLKQLVLNLADNALRYTPAGGTVTLGLVRRGGLAALSVSDTGPGISAEHLPHIFERFYRADKGRSRSHGGTGLGLSISQWIAQAHAGRIEVQSTEGAGSTFTLLLPIPGALPAPPARAREAALIRS